jgi:hypothetical protein
MKHEEIMQLMERRSHERKKKWVTDEDVKQWLEEEEFEEWNELEMRELEAKLQDQEGKGVDRSFGSIPEQRLDGVFRGMSVQLNNISTAKVRQRKALRLKRVIQKYSVQFAGLGEVGVNWGLAKVKRLLALLPDLGNAAKSMTCHNRH